MQTKFHSTRLQDVDINGDPIVGSIGFYQTGTTTPITTYSDYNRATPNANPLNADSNGRFGPVFFAPADLRTGIKIVRYDEADGGGSTVYTDDRYGNDVLEWADLSSVITAAQLGAVTDARTQAEIDAGLSDNDLDFEYEELDARRYGGVGDGATNDTIALQRVINVALHGNYTSAILPPGNWLHNSPLYYQYDASNNPDAPSGSNRSGDFTWRGVGANDYAGEAAGVLKGSRLVYGGATGDGHVIDGTSSPGIRGVGFEDLTIRGNTTGWLANFDFVSRRGTGLKRCTLYQENASGNGALFTDCFYVEAEDCYIAHPTAAIAGDTTIGLQFVNVNQAAGIYNTPGTTVRGFGLGAIFGDHTATASGGQLLNCISSHKPMQAIYCATGIVLARGARNGTFVAPHLESCVTAGMLFKNGCSNITVLSPYFQNSAATAADCVFGVDGGNTFQNNYTGIHIVTPVHINTQTAAYEKWSALDSGTVDIVDARLLTPSGTPVPFKIQDVAQHGFSIVRPDIGGTWTTYTVSDDGTSNDLTYRCEVFVSADTAGVELRNGAPLVGGTETLDADDDAGTIDLTVSSTFLDSSAGGTPGAFALTLPDGTFEGQQKTLLMTGDSGNVTVTITSYHPSVEALTAVSSGVATFADVDDLLVLRWTNDEWALVNSHGI